MTESSAGQGRAEPPVRVFCGIEITADFVDDLVEEWHENPAMPTSLGDFVVANTGWSAAEYEAWVVSGTLPPPPGS